MGEFQLIYKTDLTQRQLKHFWDAVKRTGRDRAFMYSRPPEESGFEFLSWCRAQTPSWLVLFRGDIFGWCALTDIEGRRGFAHFVMLPCRHLRTSGGMPVQVAFLRRCLAMFLYSKGVDDHPLIDAVYGITPATNSAALHCVRKAGAFRLGTLPGYCHIFDDDMQVNGIVTLFTRKNIKEDFLTL